MRLFLSVVVAMVVASCLAAAARPRSGAESGVDWIAYIRHDDVYVVDPASGETRRLTKGRAVRWILDPDGDLSVSPDGTEVAYTVPVTSKTGRVTTGRTIDVQAIAGGEARNIAPWNSVGVNGAQARPHPTHIDPQWVSSTQLDYTDDLETNGESRGVEMTVDLATGRHGRARVPSGAKPGTLIEPFVAANGYSAYPVFDLRKYDCASTLDLARGHGTKEIRLTYTLLDDEEPLDIDAKGDVLAMRFWVTSGKHDGLCTNGPATLTYELVVVNGNGTVRVLHRFAGIRASESASSPTFDAAWSPDGSQIAYIDPRGNLIVTTAGHGGRRLVVGGVRALDW